jgi:hypothetical protein
MTVALVHLLTASAEDLRRTWSTQFRPIDFGEPVDPQDPQPEPQQAYGPSLPEELRGITLSIGDQTSAGLALFDSYADARRAEPMIRTFWAELAGTEVPQGVATGVWHRGHDPSDEPARMIWVAPAPEPEDKDPEPEPD